MKEKLKLLGKLFTSFLKIGMFTFGGGYAMIPLIQKEAVDKNKWVSNDDILDIIAISESTPGPISVNAATFIGYRVAGFWGSFISTFGLVLPSFLIIYIISFVFDLFKTNEIFGYAYRYTEAQDLKSSAGFENIHTIIIDEYPIEKSRYRQYLPDERNVASWFIWFYFKKPFRR